MNSKIPAGMAAFPQLGPEGSVVGNGRANSCEIKLGSWDSLKRHHHQRETSLSVFHRGIKIPEIVNLSKRKGLFDSSVVSLPRCFQALHSSEAAQKIFLSYKSERKKLKARRAPRYSVVTQRPFSRLHLPLQASPSGYTCALVSRQAFGLPLSSVALGV